MKLHVRVLLLWALSVCAAPVLAQEDAASDRSATFQAVSGPKAEQVPGGSLLVSAYAVVMVLLVGYVGRLAMLQRKTTAEVERLSQAIERARKAQR